MFKTLDDRLMTCLITLPVLYQLLELRPSGLARHTIVPMANVPEATWLRRDSDPGSVKRVRAAVGVQPLSKSSLHVRGFQGIGQRPSLNLDLPGPLPRAPDSPIVSGGFGREPSAVVSA